jgi:hypothetical protein
MAQETAGAGIYGGLQSAPVSLLSHAPPQAWPQAGHNVRPDVRAMVIRIMRFANASTVWGELFNRPVCGFFQSGKKREANNSRPEFSHTQSQTALVI